MSPRGELVGLPEIAERLHLNRSTLDTWRNRGQFIEPAMTIGGRPVFEWRAVESWARRWLEFPGHPIEPRRGGRNGG